MINAQSQRTLAKVTSRNEQQFNMQDACENAQLINEKRNIKIIHEDYIRSNYIQMFWHFLRARIVCNAATSKGA